VCPVVRVIANPVPAPKMLRMAAAAVLSVLNIVNGSNRASLRLHECRHSSGLCEGSHQDADTETLANTSLTS